MQHKIENELHLRYSLSLLPPSMDKSKWIISEKIDIEVLNEAYVFAAKRGDLAFVQLLSNVTNIVDPSDVKDSGRQRSVLLWAAENGHLEVVKFAMTLPDPEPAARNSCALYNAAKAGQFDVVKYLLDLPGTDPTKFNNAAICNAVKNGHLDVVKLLLTQPGVDPMANNHMPIKNASPKHKEVVDYLASLPCYNPFAPNITFEKKKELIEVLTNLNLEHHIIAHKEKTIIPLSFLFFNNSDTLDTLPPEVKKAIAQKAIDFDNRGLNL